MAVVLSATRVVANSAEPSQDIRTFVTLRVNTIEQDETLAILRGDDVLVPFSIFEKAGVHGITGGKREEYKNVEYVSLLSLAPDVKFKLDTDSLALDITVAPSHLGTKDINVLHNRPANIEYTSGSSAYLNYALTGTGTGNGGSSAYFETGIDNGQDSFHLSFTAETEAIRRGLIYYEMDDRDSEISRVAGDVDAASGDLGGSEYMAGFGITRDFALDPYDIHYPLPTLSGVVATPSVANVYVNGQLVQRIDLPPGSFNLNQLPITTGSGNAQVVVTNAFGQSQTYSQQYYSAVQILTPGTEDYQYSVGLLRQNAFSEGDSYGPLAAVGRYRVGVTDSVTLGGRFEATPDLISAGPEIDFKLPIGSFHVAAAASDDLGLGGLAASLGYDYTAARYGFGFSMLAQGPYYANVTQAATMSRTTASTTGFANAQVGPQSTVSLQFSRNKMRDTGTTSQWSVTGNVPVARGYSFALTALRNTSTFAPPSEGLVGTLNFSIGRAQAAVTSQIGTTKDDNVQISESPEQRYGFGYSALYDPSYGGSLNASLLYRAPFGTAELDYGGGAGAAFASALRFAGAVAFIDGSAYASPPVLDSFALVDVPNLSGVGVYLDNQYVGTTNAQGKLLVPDLLPNYGNELRIDDSNVPDNVSIQTVDKLIAPPVSAGALVTFPAERLFAIVGAVIVKSGGATIVPKYGQLGIANAGFHTDSALGENGEFYLENVPPGKYTATVVYAGGQCAFEFVATATTKTMDKVGTLTCTAP